MIADYRQDAQLMRFVERSPKLRALIGDTPPERVEVVFTGMDKAFDQRFLGTLGARSHNYYVLNHDTGERMHVHFSTLWEGNGRRLLDAIGKRITPNEMFWFEVTGFRPAPRTETYDPTLETGLSDEFPPGYREALKQVNAAPRAWGPEAEAAFVEVERQLRTGLTDWAVTDRDTLRAREALGALDPPQWLAVIERLNITSTSGRLLRTNAGAGSLLEKLLRRGVGDDLTFRILLDDQIKMKIGARTAEEVASFRKALSLE